MFLLNISCLLVVLLIISLISCQRNDPDLYRSTVELIESRGFIAEVHQIQTEDNYLLICHRIVNPLCGKGDPVLLQHGLLASSADFVLNSPGGGINDDNSYDDEITETDYVDYSNLNSIDKVGNNLGFVLSKRCYDVWMSNSRGNVYSTNHTILSSRDHQFWNFSFDEMAKYDLPAFINYILKLTGYKQLSYIAHSQGTTQMFALLSTNKTYSNIIKPFIALAPIATVGHVDSPLVKMAADTPFLASYLRLEGGPFIISDHTIEILSKAFCQYKLDKICLNLVFLIAGYDGKQINLTRLQVYVQHTPAGTSNWAIAHYLQMIKSKKFAKMDLGKELNLRRYGQSTPPEYPLDVIDSKDIAFIYGSGDWLADQKDLQILRSKLKVPLIDDYLIPFPSWNHIDFLWAKDLGKYVNSRILKLLSQYWPTNDIPINPE